MIAVVLSATTMVFAEEKAQLPSSVLPQHSPVDMFRLLMATNASAREEYLATKSPDARRIIEAKLREYGGLMSEEREARLRALQVRWQTLRLMKLEPAERTKQLSTLTEMDRAAVRKRLGAFEILPPPLQKEVLSNAAVMRTLAQGYRTVETTSIRPDISEEERKAATRKEQLLEHFRDFFDLPSTQQSKALSRLSQQDRAQMEKTLSNFSSLSGQDREEAIEGFKKFAELSASDRVAFLTTAARWRTMSEKDRELWRRIVARLQAPPPRLPMPTADAPKPQSPPQFLGQTN